MNYPVQYKAVRCTHSGTLFHALCVAVSHFCRRARTSFALPLSVSVARLYFLNCFLAVHFGSRVRTNIAQLPVAQVKRSSLYEGKKRDLLY